MKLDLALDFDINKATAYFQKLLEKKSRIELKEFRAKRSLNQNSYLHVCYTIIANETGYTIQEAKTITKRGFGSFMIYEKDGVKFLRSTADLDTLETTTFAQEQLGAYIPTPDEFIQNQFEILKQLQHVS